MDNEPMQWRLKYTRKRLVLATALVVLAVVAAATRARAFQEWYHTVTVQGRVTMFLLNDQAKVDGLLLDGGAQVRLSPHMAEAVVARTKAGDAVSVVGRGGRSSSFGRAVHATELTINGQMLTAFEEPRHGPPPGPRGPRGPQRENAPPPPPGADPRHAGRGQAPPPPPLGAGTGREPSSPPPDAGRGEAPPPPAPDAGRGQLAPPPPPDPADAPPPPPPAHGSERVTVRGKVQAFLVGERGEVVGLAFATGEQLRFGPRVGEVFATASTDAHPDVVVEGDALRSDYGTIVRPALLTVGARTLIVSETGR